MNEESFTNKLKSRLFIMAFVGMLVAIGSWLLNKPIPPDTKELMMAIIGIFAGRDVVGYVANGIKKKKE